MVRLSRCPACGSSRIGRVRRELKRRRQGRTYKVPQVEFWECCDCGERAYDREAIRKIQAHSRAFAPTLAGK